MECHKCGADLTECGVDKIMGTEYIVSVNADGTLGDSDGGMEIERYECRECCADVTSQISF